MIVYDLTFNKLKKKSLGDLQNVIYEVEYQARTQSEEYPSCSYFSGGRFEFSFDELDANNFVPFDEVNKETILNWILQKEGVGSIEDIPAIKYTIENVQMQVDYILSETEVQLSNWKFTNKEPETN